MLFKKILLIISLLTASVAAQQVPKWTLELDDQIEGYNFLKDGNFLFLRSGENAYLYDAVTGQKIYALEIDDYEKEGAHQIVGDNYIVSTSEAVRCYNALTGKLIWEKQYADIDQKEFGRLFFIGDVTVLRYGSVHVGIDLKTGNEIWRQDFGYNQQLYNHGAWNYKILPKQNRYLVMLYAEELGLFDIKSGDRVFLGENYVVNSDLTENGREWGYISKDERYIVCCLDEEVAVVDIVSNKEIYRMKTDYDGEREAIYPVDKGCVVIGEDNTFFFNEETGKLTEIKVGIDDFRTFKIMSAGSKEYFFAGLVDGMMAIDVADGKILWQSQKDDKYFDGYAHRYIKIDGNDLIVTYTNTSMSEGGVNVYLMSINVLTGKVNYKTPPLGNSPYGHADWARNIFTPLMKFMKVENTLGYEDIGFNYAIEEFEGNLVFGTLSINSLQNPETRESGGDGIALINPKTGEILFKDYLRLSDYSIMSIGAVRYADMMPHISGNIAYLVGNENIAAYDLKARKRLWVNKETIKAIPREAMVVDNVLYVKFGERKFKIDMAAPVAFFDVVSMKIEDKWDEDPFGFAAYDAATGNLLWRIETEVDPAFLTPNFSLKNNYNAATKQLYFGDEENVYALQLKRDGGKFDYVINLDKNKIGEIPLKKTYAIDEWAIGSIGYGAEYTYYRKGGVEYEKFLSASEQADAAIEYNGMFTIWGAAAKKCLRITYDDKNIFVMGTKGVAMINSADGKILWVHPWEYDQDNVQFMPSILGGKFVYCVDRNLTSVDMKTGVAKWSAGETKRPIFLVSPNNKYIFTIDKEVIKGYEL